MGNAKGIVTRETDWNESAAKYHDGLNHGGDLMPKQRQKYSKFLQSYYDLIESSKEVEKWKDINLGDYPIYQISSHGRVRRIDNHFIVNPFHSYRKDTNGEFILDRPTYLRVQLYYYENGNRCKKHCEISRLVAKAFIPIPEKYIELGYTADTLEVNHIRGGYEIYNNFVSNLEWCTSQENIDKAFETGLRHPPKGTKHHATFVTEVEVTLICECIEKGLNVEDTYNTLNLGISYKKFKPLYYNIKYKRSWKYISQHYNF